MILAALRAELFRKVVEIRRQWAIWLIGNLVFVGAAVWLRAHFFSRGGDVNLAAASILCWLTAMSITCSPAQELGRSRRDGTVMAFLNGRFYRDVLASALSKALADLLLSGPLLALSVAAAVLVSGGTFAPGELAAGMGLGLVCGLALAPAAWSAALYVRRPDGVVALLTIGLFLWTGLSRSHPVSPVLQALGAIGPAALLTPVPGALAWLWPLVWLGLAGLSSAVAVMLLYFVRSGGDLIVDRVH